MWKPFRKRESANRGKRPKLQKVHINSHVVGIVGGDPLCVVADGVMATPYESFDRISFGCLYDSQGQKLSVSERFGGYAGDRFHSGNPLHIPVGAKTNLIAGTSLYLGHWMGRHYGHFLLETLSTTWPQDRFPGVDRFVFHPFEFGQSVPEYADFFMRGRGIDPQKLVFVTEPCRFERMIIPERLVRMNFSIHQKMKEIYSSIRSFAGGSLPAKRSVYLSRSRLPAERHRVSNEVEVERFFSKRGFEIVHPQDLPIVEQIRLYSSCAVMAGTSGSALHNIVFSDPDTTLIDIHDRRNPSRPLRFQQLCNALARAKVINVPLDDAESDRVNLRQVRMALDDAAGVV